MVQAMTPVKGLPGADCARPVNQNLIDFAESVLGQVPAFWGRYFKGPSNTDPVQYQARRENSVLHGNDIRVLPIARQTLRVGLSRTAGDEDGRRNVRAILEAFGSDYLAGLGSRFFVFLDVEESHPLSADYWSGWSEALIEEGRGATNSSVEFIPAIYGSRDATTTWCELAKAISSGSACGGAWIAAWRSPPCAPPPDWADVDIVPVNLPEEVSALAWQYGGNCRNLIDCNSSNPSLQDEFITGLIMPPPSLSV
jgi:hypothetical protein